MPQVLDKFACTSDNTEVEQVLAIDDLLDYLRNINDHEAGILASVLAQTEAIGDPGLPSREQQAIFNWLDEAFIYWQAHFPIEEPLASAFARLRIVASALAITDSNFLTPGDHDFHGFLDTAQTALVGWQSNLGRVGQKLEQDLALAAKKGHDYFVKGSLELKTIYEKVASITAKDRGRARRMAQRTVEAELGRLKVAQAKTSAAQMINELLAHYQLPPSIGDFLKGAWFDSAQLALLRFGANSEQWKSLCATSLTLAETFKEDLQGEVDQSNGRQHVFEAIDALPKQLEVSLFSLQHDSEGIKNVLALIESSHMAVLRQQPAELQAIEHIPIEHTAPDAVDPEVRACIGEIKTGQWFLLRRENGEQQRLQLALKMAAEQQLLFTNHAGLKASQDSFSEFCIGLKAGVYLPLASTASFSLSLQKSAEDNPEELTGVASEELQTEADQPDPAQDSTQSEDEKRQIEAEYKAANLARREREKAREARRKQQEAEQRKRQQEQDDEFLREQAETQRILREQAKAQRIEREKKADEAFRREEFLQRKREREMTRQALLGIHPEADKTTAGAENAAELHLSTGTWLGFHDGDTPLLAKLAGHDKETNIYTFVNRQGMKLRETSATELRSLMDSAQVQVIETRSSFRDEVIRKQNKHNN